MTAGDMIAYVDGVEPNQFSTGQKLAWLNELDGLAWDELVMTHVPTRAGEHCSPLRQEPERTVIDSVAAELLIPSPYGESVYNHYLQAMIAAENGEAGKYNQQMLLYNTAYQRYADRFNRTHMPKAARGGNRIRF